MYHLKNSIYLNNPKSNSKSAELATKLVLFIFNLFIGNNRHNEKHVSLLRGIRLNLERKHVQ